MNPDEGNSLTKQNKDLQQFDDVVPVKRKNVTGFLKWTSSMFFSGRSWKDILKDLYEHQIVPEIKTATRNTLVNLIDMKLNETNSVSTTSVNSGNFLTRYIDYSAKSAQTAALTEAKNKEENIKKSGFEMPSFADYQTAKRFLDSMKAEAEHFGQLSVYDIAWKQGKTIDWGWDAYGWTSEMIQSIKEPKKLYPPIVVNGVKRNYVLDMPNAILLSE